MMECYACDREAPHRCPRCANPYCEEHGDNLCAACLDPAGVTPSRTVFRVSLFGLLATSVLALWLLVRPPALPNESPGLLLPQPSPEPAVTASPTPAALPSEETPELPSPTASPAQTPTPEPTPEPAPQPTPEPTPAFIEYVVEEGDTWFGIAELFGVDAEQLAAFNGLTLDDVLHPGDVLAIPQ